MIFRVVAPHFVAGIDIDNHRFAPILNYMRNWSVYDIVKYCEKKGWEIDCLD